MRIRWAVVAALLAAALLAGALAFWPRTVHGTVTDGDAPVAGAVVRLRGDDAFTLSDEDGRFALRLRGPAVHQAVTAWKDGYYTAAADLSLERSAPVLQILPYATEDHPGDEWLPSAADAGNGLACGNCHPGLLAQWQQDAHSQTTRNPLVQTMYTGADVSGRPGVGPGFLLDFPGQTGNCATCHAPGAALDHPEGVDLRTASGEAANGVFCQFCHLISAAHRPDSETTTGANALSLRRPGPGAHIFFGPYDDVPNPDTYLPLQRQSAICAPCHSGSYWGVPAYASFDEWQASPYAAEGKQCQDCHMAPAKQAAPLATACAPGQAPLPVIGESLCRIQACVECHLERMTQSSDIQSNQTTGMAALAPLRDPQTVFTHLSPGSRDQDILRQAVTMVVTATQGSDGVLVDVAITNSGAGHHVPSDSPLRNMLLLVTASDNKGRPLAYLGDQRIPGWGGVGDPAAGNYAGQPGKGFAKVLEDYEGRSPAPQWSEGLRILSDNRIAARATDISFYAFALPADGSPARVEVKLLFRRAFKPWADIKGWDLADITMAQTSTQATRSKQPVLAGLPPARDTQLFAPSPATTAGGERLPQGSVGQPEQCGACHRQQLAAWRASGHAAAANGPFYGAWDKAAAQTTQGQVSPLCAGCHSPIGLLTGQIRSRWTWAGQETAPLDVQAQSGVSCSVCHAITATTATGNGAYVLDGALAADSAPSGRHGPGYRSDLLDQPELCAACHEATNPGGSMAVMSTFSEWRRSVFASSDPAQRKTCQDCHFAAGQHGALRPDDLRQAATVEISGPAQATAGQTATLGVRVTNRGAGHSLPTGEVELRLMWLDVTVTDRTGRIVFSSGSVDEFGRPQEGTIAYGVTWADASGAPTLRMWEAAAITSDRRIAAQASAHEQYSFAVPARATGPLRVRVALMYQSKPAYLVRLMSTYSQQAIPQPAAIEMAVAESTLTVVPAQ